MSNTIIIPFQPLLPQVLPTIHGNVDYRDLRDQLLLIDKLLLESDMETEFLEQDLRRWLGRCKRVSPRAQQNHQLHSQRASRCNIARILLKEDYRGFAARLADSPLLQYFCLLSQVDAITVPSKSTLQRYDLWWPEAEVRALIGKLLNLGAAATAPARGAGFGERLSGHHLPGGQHPLPGRLGPAARRHPHLDESHGAHPRAGAQAPHGGPGNFSDAH